MLTKYHEWLSSQHSEEVEDTTDDGILANQMEQLMNRMEGLLHGVSNQKKTAVVERFIRNLEKRLLGS